MIKVGDIVRTKNKEQQKVVPCVVVKVDHTWAVNILFGDGEIGWRKQDKVKQTGRKIDIQTVLDSINKED